MLSKQILRFAAVLILVGATVGVEVHAASKAKTASGTIALSEGKRLAAILASDWDFYLREYPEVATGIGVHRFDEFLTDYSRDGIERRKAHDRSVLKQVLGLRKSELGHQDRLSYELFVWQKQISVEGQRFPSELIPIVQMDGVVLTLGSLPEQMPFSNEHDFEVYLRRLEKIPAQIDQVIELMKVGVERGFTPPGVAVVGVPDQIAGLMVGDRLANPFMAPFAKAPKGVGEVSLSKLALNAWGLMQDRVIPAFSKLHAYFRDSYLPRCRKTVGCYDLPDGKAMYLLAVRSNTTTNLTPEQIFALGQSEVARIRGEIKKVIESTGFKGGLAEFLDFLHTDPRFYYKNADQMMHDYRAMAERANGELGKFFDKIPRMPYVIQEIPAYRAPAESTAIYGPGASDSSRPATFFVNTYKLDSRPKYDMEALFLHEAVPGHHIQQAGAQELTGLPEFRKNLFIMSFCEGWALYAETLGYEMGFYKDPYSKFGQLNFEMWRAARLVVDTGIHWFGWTREQAYQFMRTNTGLSDQNIYSEVDRYMVWPGQALAYTIGKLEIQRIRSKAERELGASFDVRKFHSAVLNNGYVTLDILDKEVSAWIETEKGPVK
jgi:uncharacterized protein (DUF885 family)